MGEARAKANFGSRPQGPRSPKIVASQTTLVVISPGQRSSLGSRNTIAFECSGTNHSSSSTSQSTWPWPEIRGRAGSTCAPPSGCLALTARRPHWSLANGGPDGNKERKAPPGDTSTSRNAEKGRRFGLAVRPAPTRRSARAPNAFREHRRAWVERARGCIALLARAVPTTGSRRGKKSLGPSLLPGSVGEGRARAWSERRRPRPLRPNHRG
jgi:hypothetical protein